MRVALPAIDPARCTGCGWCVAACAPRVLWLTAEAGRKRAELHDAEGCTACALCAVRCPVGAIRMRRTDVPRATSAPVSN